MALPIVSRICRWKHYAFLRFARKYSTHLSDSVRVRFAPSPTGMLHLGGLRTALFNYLFAKSNAGYFILRIEDTDQTRKVPGAIEKLEEMLCWAGLQPDEGPSKPGDYGPYLQSERLELYEENVQKLVQTGHAYKCFCTSKRLALLRKEALRRGEVPGYDNKCRYLTDKEIDDKLSQNIPYVIRFKYEPIERPWTDLVYGIRNVGSVGEKLEGDFIILKADGYPTYHFANVVDDHYMNISHVLRGEEWSISTPKHIQMYAAFGWEHPQFAHLPLILNSDGTKLSKRQGDIKVEAFKERSMDPNAVLNYLTTVSGGFRESPDGKTVTEMAQLFSLDLLTSHSARLQPDKLGHLSRLHLQRCFHGNQRREIIDTARNLIQNKYKDRLMDSSHCGLLEDSYIAGIISWSLEEQRISQLDDLLSDGLQFIWVAPSSEALNHVTEDSAAVLSDTIDKLQGVTAFNMDVVQEVLDCCYKESGMKRGMYMSLLRRSLSELKNGPAVVEMMSILGKDQTLTRLRNAQRAAR